MRRVLSLAWFAGVASACDVDPPHAPLLPVVAIEVGGVPVDNVYLLGALRPLTVTTLGPDDLPLTDRRVRFTSSRPTLATIADTGVFGLLPGFGTLRIESEGVVESLPFEVREGVTVPSVGAPVAATLLDGRLTLTVPTGVAPAGTAIHARIATSYPFDDRLLLGTHVDVGPNAMELAAPITVGIVFDPLTIPAIERPALRIFGVDALGAWAELPGGTVDLASFRVSAPVTRLTKFAIVRRSTPTQMAKLAGDLQVVPKSDPVPIAPSVVVRDAQGRPVSGITVSFAVGAGGGMLTGVATASTSVLGVATLPGTWRVGASAGQYTLIASIPGGITATFTATALP
jgi:hypothetical protein